MFAGLILPKQAGIRYLRRRKRVLLTLLISALCWVIVTDVMSVGLQSNVAALHSQAEIPLLLNSGLTEAKEAEVSVILWFEDGKIPQDVWTKTPLSDWKWTAKELQTESGQIAVTLSGQHWIDKNEESNLFTWYNSNAQHIKSLSGRIYLDERISQTMDISLYLSKINAKPAQWASTGDLVSIAAYQPKLLSEVTAGQDRINIQLLSRGKNHVGQTVLAMPALLQEF